jgi:hypothetical protein
MKQIFKILKTGNFYFPIKDIGKKFRVFDTYNLISTDKKDIEMLKIFRYFKVGRIHHIFFGLYSNIIWKAIKKEKLHIKYKNCWIVPTDIYLIKYKGKKEINMNMDILKPVK